MAIAENKKYMVVPIKNEWSNFRVEQNGKDITIWGFDGKTTEQLFDCFNKENVKPFFEEVILCGIEQSRKDFAVWNVLDEASDEEGKRYLILKRLE